MINPVCPYKSLTLNDSTNKMIPINNKKKSTLDGKFAKQVRTEFRNKKLKNFP